MAPKRVDWAAEAAEMARASRGGMRAPSSAAADGTAAVTALRRRLRLFWRHHEKDFSEWWGGLPQDDKVNFLKTTIIALPPSRGVMEVEVDGKVEDVSGVALLLPELNAADLTEQGGARELLRQFAERAQQQTAAELQEAEGRSCLIVDELDERDAAWAEHLLQGGAVRPPPGSPPPGSFTVLLGEHAGRTFEATPGREREVAAARQRMGRGVMDAHVFAIMRLRQSHLLSALLALSDSYMADVLGREGQARSLRALGCGACGAMQQADGKELLFCPCGWACYCSRECQKRDYPSHKAECKRLRAQKAAAAAAQAGDGEASGTKAGGGGGGTGKHAADD